MEDFEEKYNNLSKKIDTAFKKIFIILSIIFVMGLIIGLLSIFLPTKLNNDRFNEIQNSRRTSVKTSCEEQDNRNKNTVLALNNEFKELKIKNSQQIEQTKKFTILLIDALAPIEDCELRVKKLTSP